LARLAATVVQHRVEVVDLSKAIASKGKRIGQAADAGLTDIKCVLPEVLFGRVAVGHHQLSQ
jgi:hypothetical protein